LRPVLALVVVVAAGLATATQRARAGGEEVAAIEQLKTEAFSALKSGRFDRSNELLGKAATISKDPNVQQMASWVAAFENQRQEFTTERRKQYDKAVEDVHKLLKNNKESYAIDVAAKAYLLAEDKKAFRQEPWVDSLVKMTAQLSEQADQNEQWLKSLRLYSDLSTVEPAVPEWKDKLKLATRRIRLLMMYAPGGIKAMQESESKERDAVDLLLSPTTQAAATTKPAKDEDNDAFRIDWRDTVKGAKPEMLLDALADAEKNYYRDVHFHQGAGEDVPGPGR
jgi:hypothetical protein